MRTRIAEGDTPSGLWRAIPVPTAPGRAASLPRSAGVLPRRKPAARRDHRAHVGRAVVFFAPIKTRPRAQRSGRRRNRGRVPALSFPGTFSRKWNRSAHCAWRASEADLATVAELARRIWRAHFPSILSAAQIEYMPPGVRRGRLREEVGAASSTSCCIDGDRPLGYWHTRRRRKRASPPQALSRRRGARRGLGSFALGHVGMWRGAEAGP